MIYFNFNENKTVRGQNNLIIHMYFPFLNLNRSAWIQTNF